jgi:hypothetical protein
MEGSRAMVEERGGRERHGGILMHGADGSLWFMRDDDDAPRKLSAELTKRIHSLLEREPSGEQLSFPAGNEVVEALASEYHDLFPWGAMIWWGRRLRR